jgi:MOSC domain-containing protein YiiM
MQGEVVQVSVSAGGVPKLPVDQGVVEFRGLQGDDWEHKKYHGGPDQAVLLIAEEVLKRLKAEGFAVYPGALGENITMRGIDVAAVRAGQRFRLGTALIEITKLRQPCATLNPFGKGIQKWLMDAKAKAGDANSPRWGWGGFYARVVEEGQVSVQDIISLQTGVGDESTPHSDAATAGESTIS